MPMEWPVLVLGVIAAGGLAGCVWLGLRGARLAAALDAERGQADRDRAGARALSERLERSAADANARARDREVECARALEQLRGLEASHQAEFDHLEAVHAERERAQQQRFDAEREKLEKIEREMASAFRTSAKQVTDESLKGIFELAEARMKAQQSAGISAIEERRKAVEAMVKPLEEAVRATNQRLDSIGREWSEDKGKLTGELSRLGMDTRGLRDETANLSRALREPHVRGAYGQMQLRRVAELAGMAAYCDFVEQDQTLDVEGRSLRPDLVVKLPRGRCVVVDAKANIKPYLEAIEAPTPEAKNAKLDQYARGVGEQARALSRKPYAEQYPGSADFVVMFVPGDGFLDAALAHDPDLLDVAARHKVILAGPSTLIGMLRAVAVAFGEERLAEEARALLELGRELHERARVAFEHLAELGGSLDRSVQAYNKAIGSIETRLAPTLRRFEDVGAKGTKQIPDLPEVAIKPKALGGAPLLPGLDP